MAPLPPTELKAGLPKRIRCGRKGCKHLLHTYNCRYLVNKSVKGREFFIFLCEKHVESAVVQYKSGLSMSDDYNVLEWVPLGSVAE